MWQSTDSFADYMVVIQDRSYTTDGRLEKLQLPLRVRPKVWEIFQAVHSIQPIKVIKGIPHQDKVQGDPKAQLRLFLSDLKIEIHFFGETISEEIITHEILHAYMLVSGAPLYT